MWHLGCPSELLQGMKDARFELGRFPGSQIPHEHPLVRYVVKRYLLPSQMVETERRRRAISVRGKLIRCLRKRRNLFTLPLFKTPFMRLYLLRHADAAFSEPDALRPLTALGQRQIEHIARRVVPADFNEVGVLEHSPLVRARETAELFRRFAGLPHPLQVCNHIKPDDDPRFTARQVASGATDRLLIGHNAHHELLAGLLLGQGRAMVQVAFRQAGLLALERFSPPTQSAPFGYWQLLWFVVPDGVTENGAAFGA